MQLAYLVQKCTDYCVFIRFSGHIEQLEVDIRESRKNWETEVLKTEFHTAFKEYYEKKDPLMDLKSKRDVLARIINEKEIPYEDCHVEEYIVEEFTF
jgi:hypothetical protein